MQVLMLCVWLCPRSCKTGCTMLWGTLRDWWGATEGFTAEKRDDLRFMLTGSFCQLGQHRLTCGGGGRGRGREAS